MNEPEAAIVRCIFEWSAAGVGLTGITKRLNEAGALAPRPQQGRPAAWVSSSVRAVLRRPLYRGEIVWNQTRKRDGWGRSHGKQRVLFYACTSHWKRGPVVCRNGLVGRMDAIDAGARDAGDGHP